MFENTKSRSAIPASRSVAINIGQSGISLPAVPVLQSDVASRTTGAVVQRVFDHKAVYDAIMGADQQMHDLGGTTGGAYHLVTNAVDKDVKQLVLKVGGRSAAVLASNIYNAIGIRAPKSIMMPVDVALIKHMGKLVHNAAGKFGKQAAFEVQQHTIVVGETDDALGGTEQEARAGILAGDILTGNHDRIHHENKENFVGKIAIDNNIHDTSLHAEDMMNIGREIVLNASDVHKELFKILKTASDLRYMRDPYRLDSSRDRLNALSVQKTFILGLQRIAQRAADIKALIQSANEQDDEAAATTYGRLSEMSRSENCIEDEPLELVIAEIMKTTGSSRKDIIASNMRRDKDMGVDRYPELGKRVDEIKRWYDDAYIATALREIDTKMGQISEVYAQDEEAWSARRKEFENSEAEKWENQNGIVKFFSNKEEDIRNLLRKWDAENPGPQ
jgi:hypothetical protein